MKTLLPVLLVAPLVLVGCGAAADHSGDTRPVSASEAAAAGSSKPGAGNPNIPAAARNAIPGGVGK